MAAPTKEHWALARALWWKFSHSTRDWDTLNKGAKLAWLANAIDINKMLNQLNYKITEV
jgi:hypothetical protein